MKPASCRWAPPHVEQQLSSGCKWRLGCCLMTRQMKYLWLSGRRPRWWATNVWRIHVNSALWFPLCHSLLITCLCSTLPVSHTSSSDQTPYTCLCFILPVNRYHEFAYFLLVTHLLGSVATQLIPSSCAALGSSPYPWHPCRRGNSRWLFRRPEIGVSAASTALHQRDRLWH